MDRAYAPEAAAFARLCVPAAPAAAGGLLHLMHNRPRERTLVGWFRPDGAGGGGSSSSSSSSSDEGRDVADRGV